ncbi:nicotinamide riboside transporter PnuC [Parasaccharibacter sp. TMW 2.1888]|uniref:nicotinamide riboside transporter PnuC n=1 Tax=Parasaccharibacter sp. TMW 2.1888 TaxID=2268025 RepID=UPI0020605538|nr:nicotinamide riboside transporter PnuC [Parasaccharibacter sp. TMW 2.1888]UPO79722.1 nicotinamide riboside transporter PnuC [Parasaccharibacter sp. TMW 2.1888]
MTELIAALLSASGVWLTARRLMMGWPISLLATLFYGTVFFQAHLYADTVLQGVFSIAILYGWALWAREKQAGGNLRHDRPSSPADDLPARPLAFNRAMLETGFFMILSILWILALQRWSDDPTPLLDGGLSGASLLAQLWTARRHRVSWLLWSGIDVIYTGLFINRSLTITALLYAGYTGLGLYGYWKWKR